MDNDYRYVGKSVPRIDAVEKVTGEAKYAPDLKLDNMLYARLLRSPHAHARIVAIDASRALEDPRVKAFVTIEEMPKVVGTWFSLRSEKARKRLYLKDQIARFIGDPVLAVAAEDEESANAALARIDVQYEVLPACFDPLAAMNETGVKIHENGNVAIRVLKDYGDIEQGFKDADYVFENEFLTSKQKHAPLEPVGTCIAGYDANGTMVVHSSTQIPHWTQMYLADVLGVAMNRVRVVKPHTGGAFGSRCGVIHGLEIACCFLARKTGRPVKMSFTREEDFEATEARHPFIVRLKTGITKEGVLTASVIDIVIDVGGYGTHYVGVMADALSTGVGLYRCPNVRFEARCVYTNKSLHGAMRGYGNPQINFAQESQLDIIAEALGIDPVDLRLKNHRSRGEIDPVFNAEIRSDGMRECLLKGAERIGWTEKRRNRAQRGTKRRGVGVSCLSHGTGAAGALPDPASAIVIINADGSVNLVTAASDDGQGNKTGLVQMVAEELGIGMEQICVSATDTSTTPLDGGTHGSRQTYCGGTAVKKAATEVKKQLFDFAAGYLNVDAGTLEIKDGIIFSAKDPATNVSLGDLMRKIQIGDMAVNQQLIGCASGVAPAMPATFGANFAEVEVDTETGEVRVINFVSAFDVGKAINPAAVEGQMVGGAVMGIGWALAEEILTENGKVVNGNFRDYRLLRACDVPRIDGIIVESFEPTGPYGAKGVGEATTIGVASAIANAIAHATGARVKDLCITQEKVLRALRKL